MLGVAGEGLELALNTHEAWRWMGHLLTIVDCHSGDWLLSTGCWACDVMGALAVQAGSLAEGSCLGRTPSPTTDWPAHAPWPGRITQT